MGESRALQAEQEGQEEKPEAETRTRGETFPDFMMFLLNIGELTAFVLAWLRGGWGLNHNFPVD